MLETAESPMDERNRTNSRCRPPHRLPTTKTPFCFFSSLLPLSLPFPSSLLFNLSLFPSPFLSNCRLPTLHHGYEPFNRVSLLCWSDSTVCVAWLGLTPGSQRFNLISKSDIRYVCWSSPASKWMIC